jgi:hypothetical protein
MRTLFCIIGNLRAGDLPFDSFKINFSSNVDLLLCVGNTYPESKWRTEAKYIYEVDESDPNIWFDIYDSVSTKWRDFKHTPNIWGPYKGLLGSGMIICSFREMLCRFIKDNDIKYDRYVITRADHVYISDYLPEVKPNTIYIPHGEEYGGLTDRYCVCDHDTLMKSLQIIKYIQESNNQYNNIEKYLMSFYNSLGLNIAKIKRTMYIVSRVNEQTRWRGIVSPSPFEGYYLKYPTEFYTAIQDNKKLTNILEPLDYEKFDSVHLN